MTTRTSKVELLAPRGVSPRRAGCPSRTLITSTNKNGAGCIPRRDRVPTDRNLFRHCRDGLENPAPDLIRIARGIRPAIFRISLVAAVHEAVRHAHRRATIRDAVIELIDRLR